MSSNPTFILFSLIIAMCFTISIADETTPELIDIKKTTCKEFLNVDADEAHNILVFHHGFMSGSNNVTLIDIDELARISDRVDATCVDNPNMTLFESFEVNYQM